MPSVKRITCHKSPFQHKRKQHECFTRHPNLTFLDVGIIRLVRCRGDKKPEHKEECVPTIRTSHPLDPAGLVPYMSGPVNTTASECAVANTEHLR